MPDHRLYKYTIYHYFVTINLNQISLFELYTYTIFICSVDWNPKIGVWIGATPHRLSKHDLDQFMDMPPAERSSFFRWTDGSKLNYSSKYM